MKPLPKICGFRVKELQEITMQMKGGQAIVQEYPNTL
jgi:hypothetical protein